jgi:hypothetical protein
VTGDVVNTAARLQAVAPVGEVVVGEPTFRATRQVFDYRALEPVRVKGKADPVAIWRAVAPRHRLGVDADPGAATPLVGRDVELRLLEDLWERSVQEASVQLPDLTRVCVAVDKVEPARHLLERTTAAAARDHHCVVAAHAVLAEARADLQQASARYEDAADRWARFGAVVEHGHVLLGLGRCLVRLGRAEAGQRLAEARAVFARLDARWLVAETDRWLGQVSPRSRRRLPQDARPRRGMPSR